MFAKGLTKIIILLFLAMLVPLLLDSFGIDIIEGAGPKNNSTRATAQGKGGEGEKAARAAAAASCVGGQCAADILANTNKSKILTSRAEIATLITDMNTLKTELTTGAKYTKLNGLLGSTIITNAKDSLTKEIAAAGLVKGALTSATAKTANDASIATTKLVTDVNTSIKTISDKKTGADKTTLTLLMEQMTLFNTKLTYNSKSVKDAITVLLSNPTGQAALATIK